MASLIFNNNAATTLAGSISNTSTTANLAAGTGVLFTQNGSPSTTNYVVCTLIDAATGLVNEIVHVTGVSGDTVTIVRGQEGTSAVAWTTGDTFAELWTAGQAGALLQSSHMEPAYYDSTNSGISIGPGYSGNRQTTFTAPCNGSIMVWGKLNLGSSISGAAATVNLTNTLNSVTSGDISSEPQSHFIAFSMTKGQSATLELAVSASGGSWSPVTGTYALGYIWVPSA